MNYWYPPFVSFWLNACLPLHNNSLGTNNWCCLLYPYDLIVTGAMGIPGAGSDVIGWARRGAFKWVIAVKCLEDGRCVCVPLCVCACFIMHLENDRSFPPIVHTVQFSQASIIINGLSCTHPLSVFVFFLSASLSHTHTFSPSLVVSSIFMFFPPVSLLMYGCTPYLPVQGPWKPTLTPNGCIMKCFSGFQTEGKKYPEADRMWFLLCVRNKILISVVSVVRWWQDEAFKTADEHNFNLFVKEKD